VSDGKSADGTYSLYDDGVCGVRAQIFTGGGSGDATMQTNNPRVKDARCVDYPRKMRVVYPAGDPAYPNGGTETLEVFVNLRNISNATTTIPVGYDSRVRRILSLNPPQTERCDAWRWASVVNGVTYAADFVWVERMEDMRTYHVYTADRDPVEANRVAGANRAICTTTGATHHLSVDLYVVSDAPPAVVSVGRADRAHMARGGTAATRIRPRPRMAVSAGGRARGRAGRAGRLRAAGGAAPPGCRAP
jgi:hypothetical protein